MVLHLTDMILCTMLVEYLDGDMQGESSNTVAKVKNLEVLKKMLRI
jgi:hypothetical protein